MLFIIVHFFSGTIIAFLGALPFGTVNLSVIDVTVRKGTNAGVALSAGAALIEIVHSSIAFYFSDLIVPLVVENLMVKWFTILLLVGLGFFFYSKRPEVHSSKKRLSVSPFLKGMMLSALNPQALPFWMAVFAWLMMQNYLQVEFAFIALFVLGVGAGRFLSLLVYVKLSTIIASRGGSFQTKINKALAAVFGVLAAIQFYSILQS